MILPLNRNYLLYNNIVTVTNIRTWGDEYKIFYNTSNGTDSYIGSLKDILNDFQPTNKKFANVEKTYDIVMMSGVKEAGIVKQNLPKQLAYALKNTLKNNSLYKGVILKVLPNNRKDQKFHRSTRKG